MMLKATNITKSFGELQVLKGIDLTINANEVVAIIGASGAGKSTLLQILGTLDKPDKGTLSINNEDILHMSSNTLAQFRNKNIGFIFQFHNLLPEFTALENVALPGYLGNRNEKEVQKEAAELLFMLGLSHRFHHKPNELSGGEQQRVSIARALINSPSIIFADEPSGNLDSKNAADLHNLFFKLRDELNKTFVIVTHNKELAAMADRAIEMKDGLVLTGAESFS
jgi:lipoprotein-releasing system ATP-binding protein